MSGGYGVCVGVFGNAKCVSRSAFLIVHRSRTCRARVVQVTDSNVRSTAMSACPRYERVMVDAAILTKCSALSRYR